MTHVDVSARVRGYRDPDLPLVILGERVSDGTFDHVGIDDVAAARQATEHLLSLGRRRLAAIGDQPYVTGEAAQLRTRGYREAHQRAGVRPREDFIIHIPRFYRADGAGAMAHLLDLADPPDAVFCYSDLVALGAIHTLVSRGLRVPEEVAVIGYDNIEDGAYSNPGNAGTAPPDPPPEHPRPHRAVAIRRDMCPTWTFERIRYP
jgi:LacI family repressor for deo operon, udp, cdd, tsx, nupC, and nupG